MPKAPRPESAEPLEVHGLRSFDDLSMLTASEAEALFVMLPDGSVVRPFAPARAKAALDAPARPIGQPRKVSTSPRPVSVAANRRG